METQQAISNSTKPMVDLENQRQKHPEAFLNEMKEVINSKIKKASEMLLIYEGMYMNDKNNGTDDTASTFKIIEDAADMDSKNMNMQLAERQRILIGNLKEALIRIENKTYGVCKKSGKLICEERLRATPHATMSIEVKMKQ